MVQSSDFYFQLVHQASGSFFLITPKAYYDAEGTLSDESGIADAVVPKGFYELSKSTYQYEGQSLEIGKQLLIDAGFIEINFGLHDSVEPVKSSQDDIIDEEEDIDDLLNDDDTIKVFDYGNMSTDKLLRHIRMMVISESFEEAEKIKVELLSRGVTEF